MIMHFDKNNDKKITVNEFHNTVKALMKTRNKGGSRGL